MPLLSTLLPAVLLVAVGIVYLLACADTRRFNPLIAVAIAVQLALALAFFAAARNPDSALLLRLSGAELLVGLGLDEDEAARARAIREKLVLRPKKKTPVEPTLAEKAVAP